MEVFKKELQIKEVEVVVENYTLCDKCNEKLKYGSYDAFSCELTYKTGESFPEGGYGGLQEMQLCEKCAVDFIELLKDNGYRINISDWVY